MSDGFPDTVPGQPWPVPICVGTNLTAAQAPQAFGHTTVFDPQASLATQGADVASLRAQVDAMRAEVDEHRAYIAKAFENTNELARAMQTLAARTQALGALAARHEAAIAMLSPLLNGLRADIDGLALIQRAGRHPT